MNTLKWYVFELEDHSEYSVPATSQLEAEVGIAMRLGTQEFRLVRIY